MSATATETTQGLEMRRNRLLDSRRRLNNIERRLRRMEKRLDSGLPVVRKRERLAAINAELREVQRALRPAAS